MNRKVYLDHAASTPLHSQVIQKLYSVLPIYANPSSLHSVGVKAKAEIDQASDTIAKCLNCEPDNLHYTSGATMSNNIVLQGFARKYEIGNFYFVTSELEHADIYLVEKNLFPKDMTCHIPCDNNGFLNLDVLETTLSKLYKQYKPVLLSVQWANNEMGVIQDMRQICDICHKYPNVFIHTDATQYIPYYPIDLSAIRIDALSMSAQKIGGLKGTGLLYLHKEDSISPLIYGDQGFIGGTENVPGIACLGEAFKCLDYSKNTSLSTKRDYLYENIKNCGELVGALDNRLPNNLNMIIDEVHGEEMVAFLDGYNIYVSSGSACSSHTDEPSHVIKALGYTDEQANSSIRFSLSDNISYEDLDYVSKVFKYGCEVLKNRG